MRSNQTKNNLPRIRNRTNKAKKCPTEWEKIIANYVFKKEINIQNIQ